MYLKIENPGVCPLEGWFILGLSTARGNQSSIGQFGTGNKHAVCVLLRNNIEFHIYRGTERLTFFSVPKRMNDINYELVCYRVGNSPKIHNTSMCLEHGALDWTTTEMALRELVSNAVDASSPQDVVIERVDSIRAKRNTTRIFIRAIPEVVQFYRELYDRFLVFDDRNNQKILNKSEEGQARIYRKGVLICKVDDTNQSVFDYNCGEELKIDETRNLSEYAVREKCAELVAADLNALKTLFHRFNSDAKCWEAKFSRYDLVSYRSDIKELWQQAWQECFGDAYVSQPGYSAVEDIIRDRRPGTRFVHIHATPWFEAMKEMGIPDITQLFNELDKDGLQTIPTTQNTQDTFNKVWNWLTELDLTEGKPKPNVGTFKQPAGEKTFLGKCDIEHGTVYLNVDFDTNEPAMVEECIHYISGATDLTRKFQNVAVDSFTKACRFIFE